MLSTRTTFELIHVGKCGGSTIRAELSRNGFEFRCYHLERPIAQPDARYVVVVRDPVARFISAFNWRKSLYLSGRLPPREADNDAVALRHRVEREFLFIYKNVNALAEQLGSERERGVSSTSLLMTLIGHVSQGFSWYLDELLSNIKPNQIVAIVCCENLSNDCENCFGFRPTLKINQQQENASSWLSNNGRANLANEFLAEYATLNKLYSMASRTGISMSVRYDPLNGVL